MTESNERTEDTTEQPLVDQMQDETLAEQDEAVRPPAGGITPGWYTDPADAATRRYWDGEGWVGPALPASIPPPPDVDPGFAPEYPDGTDEVTLVGEKIHILPYKHWKTAAVSAFHAGRYEEWAQGALAGDDYTNVWRQVDPDGVEVNDMFADLNRVRPPGKSAADQRRSTRGR